MTAPPAQAGWLPPGVRHSRMRISKPIDAVMLVALIALAIFMYFFLFTDKLDWLQPY